MRSRKEILKTLHERNREFDEKHGIGPPMMGDEIVEFHVGRILEVLLDIRDLLIKKEESHRGGKT